jgi:hypothetical protein
LSQKSSKKAYSSSSGINNGSKSKNIVGHRQTHRKLKMAFDKFMKETELKESGCVM